MSDDALIVRPALHLRQAEPESYVIRLDPGGASRTLTLPYPNPHVRWGITSEAPLTIEGPAGEHLVDLPAGGWAEISIRDLQALEGPPNQLPQPGDDDAL